VRGMPASSTAPAFSEITAVHPCCLQARCAKLPWRFLFIEQANPLKSQC
jgi:hypothetical protein